MSDKKNVKMLSGADLILKVLENQGVEVIFGYPGGAVLPIYDAIFKNNSIKHVLVRHEQAAVHLRALPDGGYAHRRAGVPRVRGRQRVAPGLPAHGAVPASHSHLPYLQAAAGAADVAVLRYSTKH